MPVEAAIEPYSLEGEAIMFKTTTLRHAAALALVCGAGSPA
jgi:hypothetical protein